jgi:hypothetical protein
VFAFPCGWVFAIGFAPCDKLAVLGIAVNYFFTCCHNNCCLSTPRRSGKGGWCLSGAVYETAPERAVLTLVRDRELPELLGLTLGVSQNYCEVTAFPNIKFQVPSESYRFSGSFWRL